MHFEPGIQWLIEFLEVDRDLLADRPAVLTMEGRVDRLWKLLPQVPADKCLARSLRQSLGRTVDVHEVPIAVHREERIGDTYRLRYMRGPAGIIVALAEELS
jgi:hypothetical protein